MREEKFKVVSATDPAIDRERMPWATMQQYWRTRDFALIEPYFKPGSHPVVFHVREISSDTFASWVDATDIDSYRWFRAFMAAVELVENLPQRDGSRGEWKSKRPPGTSGAMSDEEVARFRPEAIKEIGRVCYEHSFLDPRKPLNLPPPPMSERYLRETDFLAADASPSTAAANS